MMASSAAFRMPMLPVSASHTANSAGPLLVSEPARAGAHLADDTDMLITLDVHQPQDPGFTGHPFHLREVGINRGDRAAGIPQHLSQCQHMMAAQRTHLQSSSELAPSIRATIFRKEAMVWLLRGEFSDSK